MHVDLGTLPFVVVRELFSVGDAYVEERATMKAADKKRKASLGLSGKRAKQKSGALRIKDPW